MSDYLRFFRPKPESTDDLSRLLNNCNEVLDFANTAHFPKFIAWLEREALRPMKISKDASEMIESAVRANTLKEIRDTYVRRVSDARAAATQIAEE
jgi:hypothetical protein